MRIIVDKMEDLLNVEGDGTVEELIAQAQAFILSNGRVITSIRVDGKEVFPNTGNGLLKKDIKEVNSVEITTTSQKELAVETLVEVYSLLGRLQGSLGNVVDNIRRGKVGDAMVWLRECLDGWRIVAEASEKALALLTAIIPGIELPLEDMIRQNTKAINLLREASSALSRRDMVYLADLIEYELMPLVEDREEALRQIGEELKEWLG